VGKTTEVITMFRNIVDALAHARRTQVDVWLVVPPGKGAQLAYLKQLAITVPGDVVFEGMVARLPGGGSVRVALATAEIPQGRFDVLYAGFTTDAKLLPRWGAAASQVINGTRLA